MPRALTSALAFLFVVAPALAQSASTDAALESRPTEILPSQADAPTLDAVATDPPTSEQLARRIAHLYARQAELLEADASGDVPQYEAILDDLVRDVQLLSEQADVIQSPRFREVYSSILTEHEQFYDESVLDRGEIYPFLKRAFAEMHAVEGPLLEDVDLPDVPAGNFAAVIPMDINRLVERSLNYLKRSPSHVSRLQTRADTYFPMVEQILAEEGVPDELKYLAMVESALNPRARSHAGAAGMWQFIPATGRAYGLRVTREVDDRLDPEKATRAAARHLRDLYERFGDWHLALAGYNCNPAVIARAVRRAQDRTGRRATFWDIYNNIPRETRNYVPMFIATSLVLSNPTAYDLPIGEQGSRYVFDQIPVEGGTSLSAIARVLDIDAEAIRALNPSIRRSRVPTQRDPWMLRIPSGYQSLHADDLAQFAPAAARNSTRYAARTVHYGSRAIRPLAASEPGAATVLRNPTTTMAVAATPTRTGRVRTTAPQSTITNAPPPVRTVADASRTNAPSGVVSSSGSASASSSDDSSTRNRAHRVQRGENLTLIARRYGVTVNQIVNENSLRSTTIRPGQRLRINANASRARSSVTSISGPRTVRHRVRSGENLTVIARRYGVTVRQIMNWNGLRSTTIRPGQRLRIQTSRNVG